MDRARNVPMWRFPHSNERNRRRIDDSRGLGLEFLRERETKRGENGWFGVSLPAAVVLMKPNTWYGRAVRGKPARTGGRYCWIRRFSLGLCTWIGYGRTVWSYAPVLTSAKAIVPVVDIWCPIAEVGTGRRYGWIPPYRCSLNLLTISSNSRWSFVFLVRARGTVVCHHTDVR
jgi:hypothetical protein